ncbi:cdc42 effector protein 4a [Brachyhypopomus gauderio]|uniref:cdc42 effector protein 4a n=1 Tax=Brachyhypopomus gauderio TaxID=698409 RepID=UPI0040424317
MPILKQLAASSSQTKRRSRMDLTTEMISAPLGDFRHTMHVGRSGDAFGDTSFLSSRTGEPSPDAYPRSPKPGLLSRTFRSSKRSQSVTRVDQRDHVLLPPSGSPTFVKNALSLPFLNNEDGDVAAGRAHKSLASSPLKQASNGASAHHLDLELHERCFGELTDLRPSPLYKGGGMKHAESVMSFHVDLGPSMLGDILGVMEKEDEDLGYEEGKNSEGQSSPLPSDQGGEDEDGMKEEQAEMGEEEEAEQAEMGVEEEEEEGGQEQAEMGVEEEAELEAEHASSYHAPSPMVLEMQSEDTEPQPDSCSTSSADSHDPEDQPTDQPCGVDADDTGCGYHPCEEGAFSSFLEEEDDEIRV